MSKRATKKAGKKWKPKEGDRVKMVGEVIANELGDSCVHVKGELASYRMWISNDCLRPAVEVFARKPEKKAKPRYNHANSHISYPTKPNKKASKK
jgi:hypothetical protein